MNKKKAVFILIPFLLVITIVSVYFIATGVNKIGRGIDAKVVNAIPEGFVPLPKDLDSLGNGLRYVPWESQISFLDINDVCIYQTGFSNSNFIVKYNNEYYVNEEKLLELIDIANTAFEKRE